MFSQQATAKSRLLAACAQQQHTTRGREHIEETQNFYNPWTFDSAKILSSRAWATLSAKAVWDHPAAQSHTFLQTTTQATFLARQIARALHCNEELAEACSLVINLGHCPGAYEGWRTLSWTLSAMGGFNPSLQALRVVDEIETTHPDYNGLNLTWETREILIHATGKNAGFFNPVLGFAPLQPSLEASIALHSHRIALSISALTCALNQGLAFPENFRHSTLWQTSENHISRQYKRLEERRRIPLALAHLRDTLIQDLIKTSRTLIEADEPASADEVRQSEKKYICQSQPITEDLNSLQDFLNTVLNHDPLRLPGRQRRIERLNSLITLLRDNITLLGPYAHQRLRKEPPLQVVCDFIALLTDEELRRMLDELLIKNSTATLPQSALQLE